MLVQGFQCKSTFYIAQAFNASRLEQASQPMLNKASPNIQHWPICKKNFFFHALQEICNLVIFYVKILKFSLCATVMHYESVKSFKKIYIVPDIMFFTSAHYQNCEEFFQKGR